MSNIGCDGGLGIASFPREKRGADNRLCKALLTRSWVNEQGSQLYFAGSVLRLRGVGGGGGLCFQAVTQLQTSLRTWCAMKMFRRPISYLDKAF